MSTPSQDVTFQKTLLGVGVQETSRSQDDLLHPRLELDLQSGGSGFGRATGSDATCHHDDTAFHQDIIRFLREKIVGLEASENAKHAEILRRDIRDAERERKTTWLEATCENYRSRVVDLENMLIQRNVELSEHQRQLTTLNDALTDTLVELKKAKVLQRTAEKNRDEHALVVEHMHRESEKLSQGKAHLEARLQDLQQLNARLQDARQTEAAWWRQVLERHAAQAAQIEELRSLVANCETLRMRDIQVHEPPLEAPAAPRVQDIPPAPAARRDDIYNEADVIYNEAGVVKNETDVIYNETDVIYKVLRALVGNFETLPMRDIQGPEPQLQTLATPRVQDIPAAPRRPIRSATAFPTSRPAKRTRFTMTRSEAPQCRQCDTVFTDRDPHTVPCRFHAHAPLLYKTWHKQEDATAAGPPISGKLLFWPCCEKLGTTVPVGCRKLKYHDIVGEEVERD